jgi:hypothetical protein
MEEEKLFKNMEIALQIVLLEDIKLLNELAKK